MVAIRDFTQIRRGTTTENSDVRGFGGGVLPIRSEECRRVEGTSPSPAPKSTPARGLTSPTSTGGTLVHFCPLHRFLAVMSSSIINKQVIN